MKKNYNELAMKWMFISMFIFLITAILLSFVVFSFGKKGNFYYAVALIVAMLVSGLIWFVCHILWFVNLLKWKKSLEFNSIVKSLLTITIIMFFIYLPLAWILTFVANKYYLNLEIKI